MWIMAQTQVLVELILMLSAQETHGLVYIVEGDVCYLGSFFCSFQKNIIQIAWIRHYLLITGLQSCKQM